MPGPLFSLSNYSGSAGLQGLGPAAPGGSRVLPWPERWSVGHCAHLSQVVLELHQVPGFCLKAEPVGPGNQMIRSRWLAGQAGRGGAPRLPPAGLAQWGAWGSWHRLADHSGLISTFNENQLKSK